MLRLLFAFFGLTLASSIAHALPVADSIADFSNIQGQNGWQYGFFNQGPNNSIPYTTGAFTQFANYDSGTASWQASDAQVGSQNNEYLGLSSTSGHPTGLGVDAQDSIIWAVRRYVSEVDGDIDIAIDLGKDNTNPDSGGITGRLFVNGNEIFTQFIQADDSVGIQKTFLVHVGVGDLIDFAIDPLGVATTRDGIYAPRADGTHYSARISEHINPAPAAPTGAVGVPLSPIGALIAAGLMAMAASRRLR